MPILDKRPLTLLAALFAATAFAQTTVPRDQFFWLGEINKASAVINTDEGLLDKSKAPKIAAGLVSVLEDGAMPGAKRPVRVIDAGVSPRPGAQELS